MLTKKLDRFGKTIATISVLAIVTSGCSSATNGSAQYPQKPITFTAPAEPGSGWDTTARALVKTLEENQQVKVPLPVQNKPGGTGCSWLTEMVTGQTGKDDQITVTSLAAQTMNKRNLCEYGPEDVTMIATLFVENFIVVAPKDSPIGNADELVKALKEDPKSIPVAGAGDDTLPLALFADAAGIEPKSLNVVNYDGGGAQTTALLNGDAKIAIAGVSEFRGSLESGDLKPIVTFAEEPLAAPLDQVPTAKSVGIDVTLGNWRGVYGPKDMPEEAKQYWVETLTELVETDSWKETLKKNQWTPDFRTGDDVDSYVKDAGDTIQKGIDETGIKN